MKVATITIQRQPDWWTQDNSRRSGWYNRGHSDPNIAACTLDANYSCKKYRDVGGTIMHEIGHTLALKHPWDVNTHVGIAGAATDVAKCDYPASSATMCGFFSRTSARRIPVHWDQESAKRQYLTN